MLRTTVANPAETMVIRSLNPSVTTLSVPFWRAGILGIGGRATLVRLENETVAVFSPVALTPEVKQVVAKMGQVKYLSVLDYEHHMHLAEWDKAYPGTKILGVEGLAQKRDELKYEHVHFDITFSKNNKNSQKVDKDFDAEFEYIYMPSHPNKELIFLHKPTKTLIEADLLFNLPATEQFSKMDAPGGFLTRWFSSMFGTDGTAIGHKRFLWYGLSVGNKKGWAETAKKIDAWEFNTIIPCHGEVIETRGKDIFRKVFKWHLTGGKN